MPKLRLIGAAIGALCCASAHAGNYSNAIFFGDSLSDSGSFAPALPPGTGRFTTNPGPVWAEVLGARLGFTIRPGNQGGTDFAEGGARVSQLPGVPDAPPTGTATPVRSQVGNYLATTGGGADSRALYAVWAGANDIFTIAGSAAADPASAQAYLTTTASELAGEVARLAAAGARHIVVLNLPDIGATPFGASLGAAGAAGVTQLSAGYNQLLATSLGATGIPVLQLDTFSLLREVQADPARYGFTNASLPACGATPSLLCTSASLVAPGADQDFVFADGVHPTTAAHALLADFVESVLVAPAQVSQLAEVGVRSQQALSRRLWRAAEVALSASPTGANGAWASIEGGRTELDDTDGSPWGLAIGADRRVGAETVLGAALSFERSEPDWDAGGSFTAEEVALSTYLGWRRGAVSVTGTLSLASVDYETDRRVRLAAATRSHDGDSDGNRSALGVQAAFAMQAGALHHGPVASVLMQDASVKGFAEKAGDGSTSTALTFGKQRRRSLLMSLGWQAFMRAGDWTPYGSITLSHEAEGGERPIKVATNLSPQFVQITASAPEEDFATLNLGVVGKLGGALQLSLDLSSVVGSDALKDTRLSAGLGMPF